MAGILTEIYCTYTEKLKRLVEVLSLRELDTTERLQVLQWIRKEAATQMALLSRKPRAKKQR